MMTASGPQGKPRLVLHPARLRSRCLSLGRGAVNEAGSRGAPDERRVDRVVTIGGGGAVLGGEGEAFARLVGQPKPRGRPGLFLYLHRVPMRGSAGLHSQTVPSPRVSVKRASSALANPGPTPFLMPGSACGRRQLFVVTTIRVGAKMDVGRRRRRGRTIPTITSQASYATLINTVPPRRTTTTLAPFR
jgi:hypothetical protein